VNRNTGSVLRGPNLTYYPRGEGRAGHARDARIGRPTIDYRSSADPGGGEPYVIVADGCASRERPHVGGGQVTIDRSDFAARGDSMQLDQATGFAVLVSKPRVEGKSAGPTLSPARASSSGSRGGRSAS